MRKSERRKDPSEKAGNDRELPMAPMSVGMIRPMPMLGPLLPLKPLIRIPVRSSASSIPRKGLPKPT